MRANEKTTTELNALYKAILESAGAVVDERGFVSSKNFGSTERPPLIIEGERLVLPVPEQLQSGRAGVTLAFHPLFEHANHGESKVLATLRKMMSVKLSFTLTAITANLLTLAASTAEHKKLTPDQSEFLSVVGDVDEATCVAFGKYIENMAKKNQATHMANIYLKRGGVLNKHPYNRTSIVTFQAYTELSTAETKTPIGGAKFRVKDRAGVVNLFQYVLPMIAVKDAYSAGSNSAVAPFIDALMKSYAQVASRLNDVLTLFKKHIQDAEELMIDTSWITAFDNLGVWQAAILTIPPQAGNDGAVRIPNAARAAQAATATVTAIDSPPMNTPSHEPAASPAPAAPAPVTALPAPSSHAPPGASYFASLPVLPAGQVPQNPAPVYYAPQQPVYQQPQEPMVTEHGVNFRAALAASGLGMQVAATTQMPAELMHRQMIANQPPGTVMYPMNGQTGYAPQQFQQPQRATYSGGVAQQQPQPYNTNLNTSF